MHDTAIAHANAHMYNTTVGILKESQVITQYITEADLVSCRHLLRGIARKPDSQSLEAYLRQARAVDATS